MGVGEARTTYDVAHGVMVLLHTESSSRRRYLPFVFIYRWLCGITDPGDKHNSEPCRSRKVVSSNTVQYNLDARSDRRVDGCFGRNTFGRNAFGRNALADLHFPFLNVSGGRLHFQIFV